MLNRAGVLLLRCVLAAACVVAVLSADAVLQQPRVFRTGVDVVPVYVAVTKDGSPVDDLEPEAFEVFDDGKPVDIVLFGNEAPSIAIKVLLDHSQRMAQHTQRARIAASALFAALGPEDRAGVGSLRRPGSPFTNNREQLEKAMGTLLAEERTGNYTDWQGWAVGMRGATTQFDNQNATVSSLWRIPSGATTGASVPRTIRAIVVLSSGLEYLRPGGLGHSQFTAKDEISAEILRNGYAIFGVGFEGAKDDQALKVLSERSGGWFLNPRNETDVTAAVVGILEDLRHRYFLGFVPLLADGKDHRIEVRVKKPQVLVRSRTVYKAASSPSTK